MISNLAADEENRAHGSTRTNMAGQFHTHDGDTEDWANHGWDGDDWSQETWWSTEEEEPWHYQDENGTWHSWQAEDPWNENYWQEDS